MDITKKTCSKCKKRKKFPDSFYSNRNNIQGQRVDFWCKKCVQDFCSSKDELKKYCEENGRVYKEELWETAIEQAKKQLTKNEQYLKANNKKQLKMLVDKTISRYFQQMNNNQWYEFDELLLIKNSVNGQVEQVSTKQARNSKVEIEKTDKAEKDNEDNSIQQKIFSPEWLGEYTLVELQKMNTMMENYLDTYELNPFDQDNVRMTIQTYILIQREMNKISQGKGDVNELKRLSDVYSKLSTDTRLNKKQRGLAGDADGRNSFTQMVDELSQKGVIPKKGCNEKDELEKLLDCNNQLLADIFFGMGYNDAKYKNILGSEEQAENEKGENDG